MNQNLTGSELLCKAVFDEFATTELKVSRGDYILAEEAVQLQNAAVIAAHLLSETPQKWHKTMVLELAVRGVEIHHSHRQKYAMRSLAYASVPNQCPLDAPLENVILELLPKSISEVLSEFRVS